jgi:hypothetical protein
MRILIQLITLIQIQPTDTTSVRIRIQLIIDAHPGLDPTYLSI